MKEINSYFLSLQYQHSTNKKDKATSLNKMLILCTHLHYYIQARSESNSMANSGKASNKTTK